MSKLSFEDAVARLGEFQTRGWRLGLDRMQEFLRRLGLEDKLGSTGGPRFIHVAGTNGKGSVCAFLQSLLHDQGWRVGATFSPYVYDVRERVQLGRDLISEHDFARLTETLLAVGETLDETEFGGPTEFEMKTALGFLYWAEKQAEYVALEVGLGGRLDATNVVDPACSVIVSIGLDHTEILGDTLALIATEKAGIIKPTRPVVVGDVPREALSAIQEVADRNESPVWLYGRDFGYEQGTVTTPNGTYADMHPGLKGTVQGHNLAVAVAAMDAAGAVRDKGQLSKGAALASLPGRFEVREHKGRTVVLDGAHNPQAAQALVETLHAEWLSSKVPVVTGRLVGHDSRAYYKALGPVMGKAYVARIDFHRTMAPSDVVQEAELEDAAVFESAKEAFEAALAETHPGGTILVTGSFYLVGEVGNAINCGTDSR